MPLQQPPKHPTSTTFDVPLRIGIFRIFNHGKFKRSYQLSSPPTAAPSESKLAQCTAQAHVQLATKPTKNDLKKRPSSPTSDKLNDHAPRELNTNAARRRTTSALLSATPNNLGTNNTNYKSYNIILHKFYDKFHHKFTPKMTS